MSDYRRIEGEHVILARAHKVGTKFTDTFAHGTLGQDGRYYVFQGGYSDHEWTPYISKRTGEANGGCDTCGWSEEIHGPKPTHFECDGCELVVAVERAFEHRVDLAFEFDFEVKGKPRHKSVTQTVTHMFCSEDCYERNVPEKDELVGEDDGRL